MIDRYRCKQCGKTHHSRAERDNCEESHVITFAPIPDLPQLPDLVGEARAEMCKGLGLRPELLQPHPVTTLDEVKDILTHHPYHTQYGWHTTIRERQDET